MRRRTSFLVAGLVVLVAAAIVAVDLRVPPVEPPAPPTAPDGVEPTAGTWTCAVGDGRVGTSLQVVAARPGVLGDPPATTEVATFEAGELRSRPLPQLFPGSHAATPVRGGEELGVWTRWLSGPVAVQREWRLTGGEDVPPGTVTGGCPRAIAETWVVPGLSTAGGHDARLRLANPYRTDATLAVGFVTPAGPEAPIALRNLTVPARGIREIEVNEVLPERDDLAAVVEVVAGRIAVEGYQLTRAAIGDVDGASLLAASTAASEVWTVPWVADDEDVSSWLWVTNLGERPALVELTLNTRGGGIVPDGLAEVEVPPGQLRRVDLRGTLPGGSTSAAITVRSDGAPVHVSAATRVTAEEVKDTGFVVQLAVADPAATWVVTGGDTAGREEELRLVNPGSEPAQVDIGLFDGVSARRPPALQELRVPAGSTRTVDLAAVLVGDVGSWSAFVTASMGEVVVGRVGSGGQDALHLVAVPGTPSTAWSPVGGGLAARFEPGAVQRLGTVLGITAPDPLAPLAPRDDGGLPSPPEEDATTEPASP